MMQFFYTLLSTSSDKMILKGVTRISLHVKVIRPEKNISLRSKDVLFKNLYPMHLLQLNSMQPILGSLIHLITYVLLV